MACALSVAAGGCHLDTAGGGPWTHILEAVMLKFLGPVLWHDPVRVVAKAVTWTSDLQFTVGSWVWKAFSAPILVPFTAEKYFFFFPLSSVVWRTCLSMRFLGPLRSVRLWLHDCQGDPLRQLGWIKGLKVDRRRERKSGERRSSPEFAGGCWLESWDGSLLRDLKGHLSPLIL